MLSTARTKVSHCKRHKPAATCHTTRRTLVSLLPSRLARKVGSHKGTSSVGHRKSLTLCSTRIFATTPEEGKDDKLEQKIAEDKRQAIINFLKRGNAVIVVHMCLSIPIFIFIFVTIGTALDFTNLLHYLGLEKFEVSANSYFV